jgi:hypothetical protein
MGKNKQPRTSPIKESVVGDIMSKISDATDDFAGTMTGDWYKELEAAKAIKEMKELMLKVFKGTAKYQQRMASNVSDLCRAVTELEEKFSSAEVKVHRQKEKLEEIEKARETIEVKTSKREMAAKMEAATAQVKVMDINFDKQTDDRKELLSVAKLRLLAKVKADDQPKFSELVKKADVQVLARKTTKRKSRQDGAEIWTAPILMTMPEKTARWEMEDLLRRNKVFPTFHWPREFMDPMKKMREELKKKVDEDKFYVRMRPFEKDGNWRIKADVKPKEGEGKFTTKATWDCPPVDAEVRKRVADWHVPTWAEVVARGVGRTARPSRRGSDSEGEDGMDL